MDNQNFDNLAKLDDKTITQIAQKGRDSLFFFARAILGFGDMTSEIHRPICKMLEAYNVNTRLAIVLPRDWFKSTLCTIAYPLWRSVRNSNVRILIAQNSHNNATKKLSEIKQIVEGNALFRACYPEVLPDANSRWSGECLTLRRSKTAPEGTFEAAGIGTAITSRHYDLIIEDDTVTPDLDNLSGSLMQPTQMQIEQAIGWHKLLHPILLNPVSSQILIVGTRWAERDLIGWVIEKCPEYKVIRRSVFENEHGEPALPCDGGKPVWARFNEEVLAHMQRDLGPTMFSCLEMNMPTSALNAVFDRSWIKYYKTLTRGLVYCTSYDPAAMGESSNPDYDVITTTAVNPSTGNIYVVHVTRDRMDPGQAIDAIMDHMTTYNSVVLFVEAVAYQRTLKYWIEKRQQASKTFFPVEMITSARASKVDRIKGLQPYFAAGRIFITAEMSDLERELISFPSAAHDDILDSLAMQRKFWNDTTREYETADKKILLGNPNSADAILDELINRSGVRMYPNDIGLQNFNLPQYSRGRFARTA